MIFKLPIMKRKTYLRKCGLLLIFAVVGYGSMAQKDTVRFSQDSCYIYPYYPFDTLYAYGRVYSSDDYGFGIGERYRVFSPYADVDRYVPQNTVTVYGVAFAFLFMYVTLDGQVVLYDSAEGRWSMSDSADFWSPSLTLYLRSGSYNDAFYRFLDAPPLLLEGIYDIYEVSAVVSRLWPIYEVYFDRPHVENDTFYYGIKSYDIATQHGSDVVRDSVFTGDHGDHGDQLWVLYSDLMRRGVTGQDSLVHHFYVDSLGKNNIAFLPEDMRRDGPHQYYDCIFPIITPPPCYVPELVGVEPLDATSMRAVWDPTPFGTSFEVEYGPRGFEQGTGMVIVTEDTSVVLSGLEPSQVYDIYLRARCTKCCEQWSDHALMRASTTGYCGIEAPWLEGFSLTPTFTSTQTTLHAPVLDDYTLEVLTLDGRPCLSRHLRGDLTLDVSSWPSGTYLFRITTTQGSVTKKLVVE